MWSAGLLENAIVGYVIGGDISLCTAGEERFQELVSSLTDLHTSINSYNSSQDC
jgi:hypothetical protein